MPNYKKLLLFLLIAIPVIMACSDTISNGPPSTEKEVEAQSFRVDTIATDLKNPWGMAWLPDGRMLFTERSGEIRVVQNGKLTEDRISGVPEVYARGQGGLLDIKLHPNYAENGWIYISYSSPNPDGDGANTAIMRAKLQGNAFVNQEKLFQATPYSTRGQHYGSRIVFDDNGYMFFSVGERGQMENAQNLGNHSGKIHRLHDDGRVPTDNPFVGNDAAMPSIWSYGHRNPQGMIRDASTGTIWAHEHGPRGGDELNIVEKGKNYGWPEISYGINYNGTILTEYQEKEGMEQPVHQWTPSIAPCGMAHYTGDQFPAWKGNLFVGALSFRYLARVVVNGNSFVEEEKLLDQIGRVRAVEQGPDGYIYVATEGPGMIVRLMPE
ncbi:PQQ-dependent sugar dehydrogenase [Peijinzhouia sedimentorum]